ncbi:MAG: tandem-95 repeat protein [Planctomycetes bacterium]|nr:tandem-95 repeat protein [Planctomycetota bacterium]
MPSAPLLRRPPRRDQRTRRLGVERLEDRRLLAVMSFQDGVFPTPQYDGTRDVPIFASDADANFGDTAILRADAEQSSTGSPVWSLISFDISDIPAAATVNSVSLTVNITNTTAEPGFHLFEMKTSWIESQATWNSPSEGTTWEEPGAMDPSDAGTTILGTLSGIALGSLEVSLNAAGVALVQRWIENAETNQGFVLANADNNNSVRFDSREGTTAANRPLLAVDFQFDDGQPPVATIITPLDNGPEDENPASGEVRVGIRDDAFQIALDDFELDDSTVTSAAVGVTHDGAAFTDFTYAYNAETDVITLAPTAAAYAVGLYEVTLSGGEAKIADTTGNVMLATVLVFEIDATLPTDPVAVDDTYGTDEDVPLVVGSAEGVLANDFDGNTAATAVLVSGPEHGDLLLGEDGSFTYTPEADFFGEDSFAYLVSSERSDSASARVEISISGVDDTPIASGDEYITGINTTLTVRAPGVLANDADADGDALSAELLTEPSNGTLTFAEDGSFEYTPNIDFEGVDSFQYKALAGGAETEAATVTIAINPINDALVANDDTFSLTEDGVLVLDDSPFQEVRSFDTAAVAIAIDNANGRVWGIMANDGTALANKLVEYDLDTGQMLNSYTVGLSPNRILVTDNGQFVYVTYNGRFVKRFDIASETFDIDFDSTTANPQTIQDWSLVPGQPNLVLINRRKTNVSPHLIGTGVFDDGVLVSSAGGHDIFTVSDDGTRVYGYLRSLSSYDFYVFELDGNQLRTIKRFPWGQVLNGNLGGLRYGGDFVLTVNGAALDSETLVHSWSFSRDPFVADGDLGYLYNVSGSGANRTIKITDLSNGLPLDSITLGGFSGNTGGVSRFGSDGLAFRSGTGKVYLVRADLIGGNTNAGVLRNDKNTDGDDSFSAVLAEDVQHGTLELNADGTFSYTPDADFSGTDTFTYRISDGQSQSRIGTVTLNVLPVNDRPQAGDDGGYEVNEDVRLVVSADQGLLVNDSDADADELTAVLSRLPSNGALTLNANGSFTYTPDANFFGTDSFAYRAFDGSSSSEPATVSITIHPVNDAPIAVDDEYFLDEDTVLVAAGEFNVTANDFEPDGDLESVTLVEQVTHGTLQFNEDGTFSYTPDADFNGIDTFTYRISDSQSQSPIATVTLNVSPVNDRPQAGDDGGYEVNEDVQLVVSADQGLLLNDSDVEGSELTAILSRLPESGSLTLNADGSFTYTPDADFFGTDSFAYRAFDGGLSSEPATVSITIHPVNDAPIAVDDEYFVDEDTVLGAAGGLNVTDNDFEPDGDLQSVTLVEQVTHGTLQLNEDGTFSYTPDENFNGADSFTYQIDDGTTTSEVATASIVVRPINDAPSARNDDYSVAALNRTLSVSAQNGVLSNDTDVEGDTLSALIVGLPQHGSLQLFSDGSFVYTPGENFERQDSFTYRAHDGRALSAVTTVSLTLNAPLVEAGDHILRANTPGQTISILVSGEHDISGLNLFVQIGDGGPELVEFGLPAGTLGPRITAISLKTGTIFAGVSDPQIDEPGNLPQVINATIALAGDPTTVEADGTLAILTIDTTGLFEGEWDLLLSDVLPGLVGGPFETDFAGEPAIIESGKLRIVPAEVVDRHLFYNDSVFDGRDVAAGEADDGAIAPDKTALRSGDKATFANYTSFVGGITGVMLDVARLLVPEALTAADFTFRNGRSNDPSNWQPTDAPASVTVRAGAGVNGSDRISLTWPAGTIEGTWLEVTLKSNATTGLPADDVFYFGSAVGESGNKPTDALVNATDVIAVRNNPRGPLDQADLENRLDFNRDALVNATDLVLARDHTTGLFSALPLITPVATGGAPSPEAAAAAAPQAAGAPAGEMPTIVVGQYTLVADTPNQQIEIFVSGGQSVAGVNLVAQVGDGGPELVNSGLPAGTDGPAITSVDLKTGTIFAALDVSQFGLLSLPQVHFSSLGIESQNTTVSADGLLATLSIDTTGIFGGSFQLLLAGVLPQLTNGPFATDFAGIPIEITNGVITIESSQPADLTGNGFVDFQDLTILLANWNRVVSAAEGNLVDPLGTSVGFPDLTVLLAAWTGPGPAASPQPAATGAIVHGDAATTEGRTASNTHFDRLGRRDATTMRRTGRRNEVPISRVNPLRRLQAAAVDRAMDEQSTPDRERVIKRRAGNRPHR